MRLPVLDCVFIEKTPCGSVVGGLLTGERVNENCVAAATVMIFDTVTVLSVDDVVESSAQPKFDAEPYLQINTYGTVVALETAIKYLCYPSTVPSPVGL